jgi:hypothetical protein
MKTTISALALGVLICTGCATTQRSYKTDLRIIPGNVFHTYVVEYKITETSKSLSGTIEQENANILSVPALTVFAGREGQMKVCDPAEQNGVICTALVKENDEGIEAVTSVLVKEKGRTILNSLDNISIKK